MPREHTIYARFRGPEIFLEKGRLLFSLLNAFASEGYRIVLHPGLGDKPLERYGQMVFELDGLSLDDRVSDDVREAVYLYDHAEAALLAMPWRKRLQVRFDLFSPFWTSDPIIMPYFMYPLQVGVARTELPALRASPRRMRVFFAGDSEHYRRVWIRYPKAKLPREPIVQAIRQRYPSRVLVDGAERLAEVLAGPYLDRVVLPATSTVRIAVEAWLPTLAQADFFLCPPGVVMPMSHNIVEAMAVGTIPITNYPDWMDPPLRDGVDCLAFDDIDDLFATLDRALGMSPAEIENMRRHVLDYYEAHLRLDRFVRRVEEHPGPEVPILMHSERNTALHARRLGRHSILMQGTAIPRPHGLARRLAAVYLPNLYRSFAS